MIIEQHYDDEVLIGLLNEAEEDAHVPACDTCSGTLESYRDLSAALHDNSVWETRELPETPSKETTNFLRTFAARTRAEDIAAGPIVAKLVADPAAIDQHPEWRTAGVVRGLLKVVDSKNFSEPKVAADLAALAVKVADALEPALYPGDSVMKLRATAWRELAYALMTINRYQESLDALSRAELSLERCGVSEYETARTRLLRANVYGELERFDEAVSLAHQSVATFIKFGDRNREARARVTVGGLLMKARQYREALPIQRAIASDATADAATRAMALHNTGICLRELSEISSAKDAFTSAVEEFERLGLVSYRSRARWFFARTLVAERRYVEALGIFDALRTEFQELGMPHEVALLSVDTAEVLLLLDRADEVQALSNAAIEYFSKADLAYTKAALTALAFVKEAAAAQRLSNQDVANVRKYFEMLPKQPHLLFAFPL